MNDRNFSRRQFLGTAAAGTFAGILASPARAAAQAVGAKTPDLPDLTIKEVKVYVLDRRKMPATDPAIIAASPRGQGVAAALYGGHVQIASIVTAGGIEGNYILEEHYFHPNWTTLGWLEFAKSACVGHSVLDLPQLTSQWVPEKR